MSNASKIKKYDLDDETVRLSKSGLSTHSIANALKENHPEHPDLANLSHMAVYRFLQDYKVEEKCELIESGEDVNELMRLEFVEKVRNLDYETGEIYAIMRRALKNIIEEGDDFKTIRAAKDTLDAIDKSRKNLNVIIQWGLKEMRDNTKAKETTTINVDKLLISFSKELCPICRSKVVDIVTQ